LFIKGIEEEIQLILDIVRKMSEGYGVGAGKDDPASSSSPFDRPAEGAR
jgi:hypothetical protein